ncbi:MAG: hypothetical protein Q7T11_09680, partial [Deltaproteobacteria bacterium]|nr:hypothetical protein [Deltaproteobacteria bacterium]
MQRIQVLRLLAIFCILSAPSIARGYTFLQGDVTSDGNPINGASVSLSCYTSGSSYQYCYESATTDSYGDFSFTTGKSGYSTCCPLKNSASWNSCTLSSYQWSNQKIGSSSTSQTVDISCNKSLTKNLEHPAKDKTIEVTVKAGSETITQGISVNAYQNQSPWTSSYVTSSSGGVYSLPVTEGCFSISAYCDWNYWRDDYGSCPYTGNINTTVCLSASDTSKTTELKFDVKDKVIHISVFAGSKRITDNICVYASQQSYPWGYGST